MGAALKLVHPFVTMECPVCYETCYKTYTLVCKHRFCMSCIKGWWERSPETPTCPCCRRNLYFRGMRHVVRDWQRDEDAYDEDELTDLCEFLLRFREIYELSYVRLIPPLRLDPPRHVYVYWDTSHPYGIVPRHQFRRIMIAQNRRCYKHSRRGTLLRAL